jgi:hypothetical protein
MPLLSIDDNDVGSLSAYISFFIAIIFAPVKIRCPVYGINGYRLLNTNNLRNRRNYY